MTVLRITPLWDWRALDPAPALTNPLECVGGHAAQALRLTLATAAEGVEQVVIAPRAAGGPASATLAPGVGLRGVGRAGVPGVHRRNGAWLAGVLAELPRLRRGFDVVHVHASGIVEPLWAALAASAAVRAPLVLTLHHSAQATYVPVSRRDAAVQVVTRAAERAAIRRAARTLTLTRRVAERLGGGVIEAMPDCLDAAGFAAAASAAAGRARMAALGVPDGAPVALYAGRVSPEKGWEDLLALEDLHVVVCGDGPDLEGLRARAGERIHLAGSVPAAEVASFMAAADVLVLPSRLEELGSVLIEAMAVGLPAVAYAAGGIPEAVAPEVTGLLVEPGDLEGFRRAVARALTDTALRERAAAEGPRIARERFDQAAVGARLASLYAELSGSTPTR